jgi:hypothetical protein
MEISFDNNERPAKQANLLKVISHALPRFFIWMNWFFTLTKLDRFNAGIDTSGEGRDS